MESRGRSALSALIIGVLIGAGLGVGGWFIGNGFYRSKTGARYVTVRGLVERHVRADIAVWDISYTATNNNVSAANNEIDRDAKLAAAFAHQHGFKAAEIQPIPARVTDQS
ncbi:MAG: SIMPL domain-containing protein, partial [Candidatus Binataceae bacterium]